MVGVAAGKGRAEGERYWGPTRMYTPVLVLLGSVWKQNVMVDAVVEKDAGRLGPEA